MREWDVKGVGVSVTDGGGVGRDTQCESGGGFVA